ncbi:reverse transcriptase domain-containing protein [Nitratireductor sp. XY-223]|uniref:reverse transcriptase domain-containing protein n=1 Tax=Nitratireductor sp. XY-223 TaxID=2561926 RepID=UPI0024849617|nr:reverse transcriptase domain-containing protein [Nitratireductor sp. XY-223]
MKGKALPKPQSHLTAPDDRWTTITPSHWYGSKATSLEIISETALWYRRGTPPTPIRWVLVRDPDGKREPQAFFCTNPDMDPTDIISALTPTERANLANQLANLKTWEPLPARRVYIPKAGGKKRPLGIPSLIDRCQQAMVLNALEPCWEAQFEGTSYGFRPGRCVHDAIERIHLATKSGSKRVWVLDADIKGCFDTIDHDALMDAIGNFPAMGLIRCWLKAGYVEDGVFYATGQGTPQGGVISPPACKYRPARNGKCAGH